MKRRTLDIAFSVGGVIFSVLLLIVGLILTNQKNFAHTYVRDQLAAQEISFKSADTLVSDADFQATLLKALGTQAAVDAFVASKHLTSEASSKCLRKFAGKQMLTGKQAECYAEDFIRLHALESSIVDGKSYTYATIGSVVTAANKAVTDAKASTPSRPRRPACSRNGSTPCCEPRRCAGCCSPPLGSACSANEPARQPGSATSQPSYSSCSRWPGSSTPSLPRRPTRSSLRSSKSGQWSVPMAVHSLARDTRNSADLAVSRCYEQVHHA
jgi:hypothetical protein